MISHRNRGARLGVRCLVLLLVGASLPTAAAGLAVQVDAGGAPVAQAVVSLHSPASARAARASRSEIDQRDNQFVPRVLPVTVGTWVEFPNRDAVRHHVYSFSPAKRFELPLYSGTTASPVKFDLPGVATLGCNIHDGMIAYVVVLDTPHFALTGSDGRAVIDAPPGDYELRVWHERLDPAVTAPERAIRIDGDALAQAVSVMLLAPPAPATDPADARMRALQERFRSLKRER